MTAAFCTEPLAATDASSNAFTSLFEADWLDALFIHFSADPRRCSKTAGPLAAPTSTRPRLRQPRRLHAIPPAPGDRRRARRVARPPARHPSVPQRPHLRSAAPTASPASSSSPSGSPTASPPSSAPASTASPNRLGQLDYTADGPLITPAPSRCAAGALKGSADISPHAAPSAPGTEDAFLLERYTAFTSRAGVLRRFRIRHAPWQQAPARVTTTNATCCRPASQQSPAPPTTPCALDERPLGRPERPAPRGASGRSHSLAPLVLPLAALANAPILASLGLHVALRVHGFSSASSGSRSVGPPSALPPPARSHTSSPGPAWTPPAFLDLHRAPAPPCIRRIPPRPSPRPPPAPPSSGSRSPPSPAGHPCSPFGSAAWALVLLLHFGSFDLTARLWRLRRCRCRPIMDRPLHAHGLANFWGRPLEPRLPTNFPSTCSSGPPATHLRHSRRHVRPLRRVRPEDDLVISLPARGDTADPPSTSSSKAQASPSNAPALGRPAAPPPRGITGRLFAALVLLAPLPLLFPPPFLRGVLVPLPRVIGSYRNG